MIHKLVGRRVKLVVDKDVFPQGIYRAGETGKIVFIDSRTISVKLDRKHRSLNAWGNELDWYGHELEAGAVLMDEFLNQVELI
jgi:hypothetical protein